MNLTTPPNFAAALTRAAAENPHWPVLTLLHAGQPDQTLTSADLLAGAARYAAALAQSGAQPGEVVVLILPHSRALVEAYWGTVLHGAVPSIMPFLTEKLLPERYRAELTALAGLTTPAAVITNGEFEPEVRAAFAAQAAAVLIVEALPAEAPAIPETAWGGLSRAPQEIALLQHSSGTTGLQKGVALSHGAVFRQLTAYARAIHFTRDDVIVSWLPLYHDMGLIAGFLMPILLGARLVLMSPFDWVRAPQRLFQAVSQQRGTLTWLPNFAYNFCAQKIRDRHLEGVDLSSWRAVINCSEPTRHDSHRAFAERFAPWGLNPAALGVCYAMAENVFAVTQSGIDGPVNVDEIDRELFQTARRAEPARPGAAVLKMLSAGRPLDNVELRIADIHNGTPLADRQVGEVLLRSDCMLSGYYRRPEETARALRGGWYHTGDLGYLAGGELYVSGRIKDLIIVGGKNIYPQDLEELAMQAPGVHPGRVSAFGVEDAEAGTEAVVVVAEVDSSDPAEREQIAAAVREVVTRGSAVALRRVHLVGPGWLVKTSSGKNNRLANREKFIHEVGL